jgi:hypothetical protein
MRKSKRPIGRPCARDPRVHIPNVVVRQSVLHEFLKLARHSDKSLSQHVEKAFLHYINNVNLNK